MANYGAGIKIAGSASLTITAEDAQQTMTTTGGSTRAGIQYGTGSLTVSGGTVTSSGGDGNIGYTGGEGISGEGALLISGGAVFAEGGTGGGNSYFGGGGGGGIFLSSGGLWITAGDLTATGANGKDGVDSQSGGSGGTGIYLSSGDLSVEGGTVTATGGDGGDGAEGEDGGYGGSGIYNTGGTSITAGTVNLTGGDGGDGDGNWGGNGGDGGSFGNPFTLSGGTITATGGNCYGRAGGSGISFNAQATVTVTRGTITAAGGNGSGSNSRGGAGIESANCTLAISGGTVTATGGNGGDGDGGDGIGNVGFTSGTHPLSVTISGGVVKAAGGSPGGHGIVSDDAPLAISGGHVTADGGTGGYSFKTIGFIPASAPFHLTGGTVTSSGEGGIRVTYEGSSIVLDGGSMDISRFVQYLESKPGDTVPKNSQGDRVYLNTLTLPGQAEQTVTAGSVDGVDGVYGIRDMTTDGEEKVYLWLTSTGEDKTVSLTAGGAEYSATYTRPAESVSKRMTGNLSGADAALDSGSYGYTGSEIKPGVTVSMGAAALTEGEDYTVSYQNNVEVGVDTATVILTGIGGYAGTKTLTFTIKPLPTSAQLRFSLASTVYSSAEKPVSVTAADNVVGLGEITAVKYNGSADAPVDAGEYTVTAELSEGTVYAAATVTLGTYTIEKAPLTVSVAKDYDGTAAVDEDDLSFSGLLGGQPMIWGTDYTSTLALTSADLGAEIPLTGGLTLIPNEKTKNYSLAPLPAAGRIEYVISLNLHNTAVQTGGGLPALTYYIVDDFTGEIVTDEARLNEIFGTRPVLTCPGFDGGVPGAYPVLLENDAASYVNSHYRLVCGGSVYVADRLYTAAISGGTFMNGAEDSETGLFAPGMFVFVMVEPTRGGQPLSGLLANGSPIDYGYTQADKVLWFFMPEQNVTVTPVYASPAPGAPSYQAEVGGGENALKVPVTVNTASGTASAELSSEQLKSAGQGKALTVAMPAVSGVTDFTLGLPVSGLASPSAAGSVTLSTGAGSITLPGNMLSGESGSKARITLSAADPSALPQQARTLIGGRPVLSLSLTIDGKQVSWNNPSAPVTVSVPYSPTAEELKNPESLVIWYIDGEGNAVCIPDGRYDAATGTVVFTTTHFSWYAVGFHPVAFSDVADSAWYASAVRFAAARGVTTGVTENEFRPDASLTRGQFITMLLRALGIEPDEKPSDNFSDAGSTYYTGYLAAAKRLSIADGIGGNQFAPEKAITREELFKLLYSGLAAVGRLPEEDGGKAISDFSDGDKISSWAREAMAALVSSGVVTGIDGSLSPQGSSTRAQMAQVLYNLLNK